MDEDTDSESSAPFFTNYQRKLPKFNTSTSDSDYVFDESDDTDEDWQEEMETAPKRSKIADESNVRRPSVRHQRPFTRKRPTLSNWRSSRAVRNVRPAATRGAMVSARLSHSLAVNASHPSPSIVYDNEDEREDEIVCKSRSRKNTRRTGYNNEVKAKPPNQCLGFGCTKPTASQTTKYCSRICGLSIALRRLERFLPSSRSIWYPNESSEIDSYADRSDHQRLKELRLQQFDIHSRLIEMANEHQELNALLVQGQTFKLQLTAADIKASVDADLEEVEQSEPVVCVTCSSEINMRHALRHMEKCFQKVEGSSVLFSTQKEQSKSTPLFCDLYDAHTKSYCKRFHAVCEHFKEPKYPADSICGFPLIKDVFVKTGRFCCTPRQKCTRHFGWERKKRAEIDVERYRQLIRMDEILQEEARLRLSLSQRGGILGMMLHKTVNAAKHL